jgi:hypothetical protein
MEIIMDGTDPEMDEMVYWMDGIMGSKVRDGFDQTVMRLPARMQ